MVPTPYDIGEIRWRMRVTNLQARIELGEIEAASYTREIASRFTSLERETELVQRRLDLRGEIAELKAELSQMSQSFSGRIDVQSVPGPGHRASKRP
jgi:hypothetical protein